MSRSLTAKLPELSCIGKKLAFAASRKDCSKSEVSTAGSGESSRCREDGLGIVHERTNPAGRALDARRPPSIRRCCWRDMALTGEVGRECERKGREGRAMLLWLWGWK